MNVHQSLIEFMDLSIITVTYQSKDYIDRCILSVITHTLKCTYEHIIVDNGSTDGTIELIEMGYSSFVHLIKNTKNLGFAAANNQAALLAKGRYFLFLNPDMELHKGYLDSLIEWMDKRPDVGMSSCKLLCNIKIPSIYLRPHQFFTLFSCCAWVLNFRSIVFHPKSHYSDFDDDMEREVDLIRGSFMFTRRQIFEKLGFAFDPRYFILVEDIDLCHEVKRLGYKIMYLPCVDCIDYHGRSFNRRTDLWRDMNVMSSFAIYAWKWHKPHHQLWLQIAIVFGILFRIPRWIKNAWCHFVRP